jgi:hopanoid biosynthesis associated protein HpnK
LRRLIVNADDFGLTSGVNRGIVQAHENGLVTSTTVMACGERFDEAASLPARAPRLSVGCHLVLVDGRPILSPSLVLSLVDDSGSRFRDNLMSFAGRAVTGRVDSGQIEAEATAQIKRLQSAGIAVSHLDSHKHTHMFPTVLRGALKAAKACGVRAIRNPFEPLVFASLRQWKRQFQLRMLGRYRASFRDALANAGVSTPDGCVGIAATGGLTSETFERLIENLPEGTWEFVSHPGYSDPELDRVKTRLRASRENELAILTSPQVKDLVRREGIELISYREL